MKNNILLLTLLLGFFSCQTKQETQTAKENFKLQTGDILFQDLDCGPFCEAITKVTEGYEGNDYSHCGIVSYDSAGNCIVLEAVGKGVMATPIEEFFNKKVKDDFITVGRLKKDYQNLIPQSIVKAESLLGKEYDDIFDITNDSYYCSELVYETFKDANGGKEIFKLFPMTYKDPDTNEMFPIWVDYFEKLGAPIPEGEAGLNPGGISRSPYLDIHLEKKVLW
ncbi:YiiX/YebB-like N1pC/P60 family cysteine hydrolase [Sediminitomix flava]|uniref:Permuted papain-like amidase YaeF/Yiix C92 family enzyme n=1 Tax=Sediminitomix flava TaxID=379075 RepID=A0A315Z6K4_SEDFL|nr:YiiX/YebB-like N1pC/P60 family cysteine hydrolase [Sediminitomix flava]PWJ39284.1 permuted papain-like amidase YaeF/Yiix C92 family enzyme [Sediminitomix flava]